MTTSTCTGLTLTIWANLSADGDEWSWVLLPVGAVYGSGGALTAVSKG